MRIQVLIVSNISRFFCILLIPVLIMISDVQKTGAQEVKPSEYEVKSAFLYNFVKFVEWPKKSLPDSSTTMNLCIAGEDQLGSVLEIYEGEVVRNKKLLIKHVKVLHQMHECHILYIGESENERLSEILRGLKDLSILTVGDKEDFAKKGVIVNFYLEENKVRFEINVDAANRAKLIISSKPLKIARIIHDDKR